MTFSGPAPGCHAEATPSILQHDEVARAEPCLGQEAGRGIWCRCVCAEDEHAVAGGQVTRELAMFAQDRDCLGRPPHPGASQGHRRDRRQDDHLSTELDQGGGDAGHERIARRQRDDVTSLEVVEKDG